MSDMKDRVMQVILAEADVGKGFIPDHAKNKFSDNSGNLKCPFCNGELVGTIGHPICRNQDCVMCDDPMPQDLLEELDRTRKALELAIKGLKNCKTRDHIGAVCRAPEYVDKILEQITALEQKDVK